MSTTRRPHRVQTVIVHIRADVTERVLSLDWRTDTEISLGRSLTKGEIWDRAMLLACKIKEKVSP